MASFFEGYDFTALGQILPNFRAEMGLSEAGGGQMVSVISLGAVLSYGLVRLADRWGRRPVLSITILGYAIFTFLTGFSRNEYDFAAYQLLARIFLVAEWAVAIVYAAEEYPAESRAFIIGIIQASTTLGSIVCAVVVPLLLTTPFGWRSVYWVGVLPLLLLARARRELRETSRFLESPPGGVERQSLFRILKTPYRGRVLQLALIWSLTYACTQSAVVFWKEFAVGERGFTDGEVGLAFAIATMASLPFVFVIGKLIDRIGRRPGAVLIYGVCSVFVVAAFQLHNFWLLTICLMAAVFSGVGILTLLNAYTTELFPTEMRGDAFALSNNLFGRIGYIAAPALVGIAAGRIGWGNAVSLTAGLVVVALILILTLLPETRGLELEESSAL